MEEGGIMSDDLRGVTVVLGAMFLLACLGLAFSIGRATQETISQKEWKCSESAIVDGKAECVEYKKVEE